ncbi:hypothetical protein, partial [Gluconobacter japonicus]|uniref:hypothetical protein n=1 Tax=Gluconobacter japonicus TaxID=376620 RepID=UPI0035EAAF62
MPWVDRVAAHEDFGSISRNGIIRTPDIGGIARLREVGIRIVGQKVDDLTRAINLSGGVCTNRGYTPVSPVEGIVLSV